MMSLCPGVMCIADSEQQQMSVCSMYSCDAAWTVHQQLPVNSPSCTTGNLDAAWGRQIVIGSMMVLCLYMSHLSDLLGAQAWESCLDTPVKQHILT